MENHQQYHQNSYPGTYQNTRDMWENRANNSDDNIAPGRERIADELRKLMLDMAKCVDMEDYEGMIRVSHDVVNFEKKQKNNPTYYERFTSYLSSLGGGAADLTESARKKNDAHVVARELTQRNSLSNQEWTCQSCTTYNDDHMVNCQVCGGNRGMPADNHQHHLLVNATQNYQRRAEMALWVCNTCGSENPAAVRECGTCCQDREDKAVTGMINIASPKPQLTVTSPAPAHVRQQEEQQEEPQASWLCDTCATENTAADRECGICGEKREDDSVTRMNNIALAESQRTPKPTYRPQQEDRRTDGLQQEDRRTYRPQQEDRHIYRPQQEDRQIYRPQQEDRQIYRPQQEDRQTYRPQHQDLQGGSANNVNRMNQTPARVQQQFTDHVGTDEADVVEHTQPGTWKCPNCTFVNDKSRPGCKVCAASSPEQEKISVK